MSETIVESQQSCEEEAQKSFDILATIRLYQHDLANGGYIRPETKQRVYDEEFSYIAEGINRHISTEFTLQRKGDDLVYFHNGQWRPYLGTLMTGLETYRREAEDDPRKKFMADRAVDDLGVGYKLDSLKPGEKLKWYSTYPELEEVKFGKKFVGNLGFQPHRRMGFIYEAEGNPDGSVNIRSQSVDNSDNEAFEAAMTAEGIDEMLVSYDQTLTNKDGGQYYAGRSLNQVASLENAWFIVTNNKELIEDYFLNGIERLAKSDLPPQELEVHKKRLTYGVWARLKEIIDEQSIGMGAESYHGDINGGSIQAQVEAAYSSAAARGEVLFGCGGSINGENAILQASASDVLNSIFGREKIWFGCYYCGAKQFGDPCASSLYCPTCTAEIKNGKIISTGRGRQLKKGFLDIFSEEMAEWNRRYDIEQAEKRAKQLAIKEEQRLKAAA